MQSRFLKLIYSILLVAIASVSQAALVPLESRLGGLAYYDPNLDITWSADANINGAMNWDDASVWAAGLTLGGVSGWRLPSMDRNFDGTIVSCTVPDEVQCRDNEYGYMFYQHGVDSLNQNPFSNIAGANNYWSGTTLDIIFLNDGAWGFEFTTGQLTTDLKTNDVVFVAWAVRDGDVAIIPIPPALYLFISGLIMFAGKVRRKSCGRH